jgi:hypothetical protein
VNITGTGAYSAAQYLWQNQQLLANSSSTAKSSSSASSLFDGSDLSSQISSMIELTKYAMDAMSIASDGRVTFSQIQKYSQQLQDEFETAVQAGLKNISGTDPDSLVFTLADGTLTAQTASGTTSSAVTDYLAANPSIAAALTQGLAAAYGDTGAVPASVSFTLGSDGSIQIQGATTTTTVPVSGGQYAEWLSQVGAEGAPSGTLSFSVDDEGNLVADDEESEAFAEEESELLKALEDELKEAAQGTGSKANYVGLLLRPADASWVVEEGPSAEDVASLSEIGQLLRTGLESLAAPKTNFALQANDDGTVTVSGSGEYISEIQAMFDNDPELAKKYQQIVALSGIEDARKALNLDPTQMRKRVQLEAIATSWYTGEGSTSYFGQYSDDSGLSLLAGLDLSV